MLNQQNSSSKSSGWAAIYRNAILTVIAVLLALLVIRAGFETPTAQAQSSSSNFYIEPGTTIIRQPDGYAELQGKVVIDKQTGAIWGFPTLTSAPYPVDTTSQLVLRKIYVSHNSRCCWTDVATVKKKPILQVID